jgi:hypothetical protein
VCERLSVLLLCAATTWGRPGAASGVCEGVGAVAVCCHHLGKARSCPGRVPLVCVCSCTCGKPGAALTGCNHCCWVVGVEDCGAKVMTNSWP